MAKYPGTLESNNPQAFGIVYADEVSGHKSVEDLNALYTISDAILSKSKTNENDDAIGQDWYVRSEANYYRLIDWSKRNTSEGWIISTGEFDEDLKQLNLQVNGTDIKIDLKKDFCVQMKDGSFYIIRDIDWSTYDQSRLLEISPDIYNKDLPRLGGICNFSYYSEFREALWDNSEYVTKFSKIISLGDLTKVNNNLYLYGYFMPDKGLPWLNLGENGKLTLVGEYSPGSSKVNDSHSEWKGDILNNANIDSGLQRITANIPDGFRADKTKNNQLNFYACSFPTMCVTNDVGSNIQPYHLNLDYSLTTSLWACYIDDIRAIDVTFTGTPVDNKPSLQYQFSTFRIFPTINWHEGDYIKGGKLLLPDCSKIINADQMFNGMKYIGNSDDTLDFTKFDFSNVEYAGSFLSGIRGVKSVKLALPKAKVISRLFSSLAGNDESGHNEISDLENIEITELGPVSDVASPSNPRVWSGMRDMLGYCPNLRSVYIDMSNVEYAIGGFEDNSYTSKGFKYLTDLRLKGIKTTINLYNMVSVNLESIKYIMDNAQTPETAQILRVNTYLYNKIPKEWITAFEAKNWKVGHRTTPSATKYYNEALLTNSELNSTLEHYISQSEKDVANGVPSLNSSGALNHSQIPALKFWQVAEAVTDKEAIVSQESKGKDYNLNVYNGNRDIDANSFNVVLEKGLHKELDLVNTDITTLRTQLNTILNGDTSAIDKWSEIESFLAGITDKETLTGLLNDLKTEIESKTSSKSITRGTISEYEPDTTHKDVLYYATDIDCVIYNKKQVSGPIYVGYVTEIPEIVTLDGNEFPIEIEQAHVTCGNIQSIIQACNKLGSIECVVNIGVRKNSSKEFTAVLKIEYSNKERFLTWAPVPLDNYGIFNEGDLCEHYNYKVDIGGSAEEGMLLYFIPVSKQNQFLADAIITTQASYDAITNKNSKTFYIVD